MRRLGLLPLVALLLAGCTGGFPEDARTVAELEVGDLGPGERARRNFSLDAAHDFLLIGFRTGPGEHVHVVLEAPNGTRFDTAAEGVASPCAVRPAPPGTWGLEVSPDAFDGFLKGGKFTVRAGEGALPPVFPCTADPFPGRGRNATLHAMDVNLTANETVEASFEQPWDLAAVGVRARGDLGNATVQLAPPGGDFVDAGNLTGSPAQGTWRIRIQAREALTNATLAAQGTGA